MKNFIYNKPTKLIFGTDNVKNVGEEIANYTSKKILVTIGGGSVRKSGLLDTVIKSLEQNNIEYILLEGIKPNPEIYTADQGAQIIKDNDIDFILAVGGGSVLDNTKHMAIASRSDLSTWELLKHPEIVGQLSNLPKIGSIITLAATGSEMNEGGVLSNPEVNEKRGMFHKDVAPVFTIEDPTLLYTLPEKQKRAGVCDILSHLCEVYFGDHTDSGFTDRITEALMLNLIDYFQDYIDSTDHYNSHANIFLTSTFSLNGTTRLGRLNQDWTSHSIEHYFSAYTDVTHGIGLAVIHPKVLRFYFERDKALGNRFDKFVNLGRNVFHINEYEEVIIASKCVEELEKLFKTAGDIDKFDSELKAKLDIDVIVEKLTNNNELGSYIDLSKNDVYEIINSCF